MYCCHVFSWCLVVVITRFAACSCSQRSSIGEFHLPELPPHKPFNVLEELLRITEKEQSVCALCESQGQAEPYFRPGYKFNEEIGGWLKFHRVPATWSEAHTRCILEGAQLASPVNHKFLEAMHKLMESNDLSCGVFTGFNDNFTPGSFASIEGVPLESQPVHFTSNTKCAKKLGDRVILLPHGTLDFANSNDYYAYICYKKRTNETQTFRNCATVDLGYVKDDRTGSYYKFHREGQTAPEAAKTCAEEDAHLVIINSATEAQVLKELFADHPVGSLGSNFQNSALIGMYDWGQPRGWLTIRGQTLEAAGYSIWSAGQPDHSPHPEGKTWPVAFCGTIFRTGLLDDVWCDVKFAFICERTSVKEDDDFGTRNDQTTAL